MKNILVAIDSCESTTTRSPLIERTIELASAFSSRVRILHVVPQRQQSPYNIDNQIIRRELANELHDEHDFLQQLGKCLQDRNVEASSLLVEGATVRSILQEADRLDADLIIMGCHQHSELFAALMNSTDEGLLSRCSRPVMFVPDDD